MSSTEARKHFDRIDGLLRRALDLPRSARAQWLSDLGDSDASLEAELRRLIRFAEGEGDALVPRGAMFQRRGVGTAVVSIERHLVLPQCR